MTESRGPVDRAVCVEFVSGYKASPCVDSHLHFCPFVRRRRSFVRSFVSDAFNQSNQIKSIHLSFRQLEPVGVDGERGAFDRSLGRVGKNV